MKSIAAFEDDGDDDDDDRTPLLGQSNEEFDNDANKGIGEHFNIVSAKRMSKAALKFKRFFIQASDA